MILFDEAAREALGLPENDPNLPMLYAIRTRAERLVKKHVGYNIERSSHVEFLPRPGMQFSYDPLLSQGVGSIRVAVYAPANTELALSHLPVVSVESVNQDHSRAFASSTEVPASEYYLDREFEGVPSESGLLIRESGWEYTPRSVRVAYTAGYLQEDFDGVAADFALAVLFATQKFFNEWVANQAATDTVGSGAVTAEGFDTPSLYYARAAENSGLMNALPPGAIKILEPRVRKAL